MTRSQLWWFWGELVAMTVGLLLIAAGGWLVHDERLLWIGVVIGAVTFIVTTIHGPTLWRKREPKCADCGRRECQGHRMNCKILAHLVEADVARERRILDLVRAGKLDIEQAKVMLKW